MAEQITPRAKDYSQWYLDIVKHAGLAENSDVRGCMVIKPHGYAIWEKMQRALDRMFKDTGPRQRLFPAVHPQIVPGQGRGDGRGLRQGMRRRHPLPAQGRQRARAGRRSRGQARRRADHPADVGNDHLEHLQELDSELSRSAAAHQPVVQRRPLGDAHPAVPAHGRVPLAGRPHRPRHAKRGGGGGTHACSRSTATSPRNGWRCRC